MLKWSVSCFYVMLYVSDFCLKSCLNGKVLNISVRLSCFRINIKKFLSRHRQIVVFLLQVCWLPNKNKQKKIQNLIKHFASFYDDQHHSRNEIFTPNLAFGWAETPCLQPNTACNVWFRCRLSYGTHDWSNLMQHGLC